MKYQPNNTFINNSNDYMLFASLFKDFEIIDNLMKKRLEENDLLAAFRYMKVMRLILDELRRYILK